jgi:hypothetical protein
MTRLKVLIEERDVDTTLHGDGTIGGTGNAEACTSIYHVGPMAGDEDSSRVQLPRAARNAAVL